MSRKKKLFHHLKKLERVETNFQIRGMKRLLIPALSNSALITEESNTDFNAIEPSLHFFLP